MLRSKEIDFISFYNVGSAFFSYIFGFIFLMLGSRDFPCETPHSSRYADVTRRIQTFGGGWPQSRVLATPHQIAEAGFYFLGIY